MRIIGAHNHQWPSPGWDVIPMVYRTIYVCHSENHLGINLGSTESVDTRMNENHMDSSTAASHLRRIIISDGH